jgi:ribonuclease-3 family protein
MFHVFSLYNKDSMTEKERTVSQMNPLVLAFVGDAYWTLLVRKKIIAGSSGKVGQLHAMTSKMVCAAAQSALLLRLEENLTEDEQGVAGRARNANANNVPKNSNLAEYKRATAFEAVVGYNYLIDNKERVDEFVAMVDTL